MEFYDFTSGRDAVMVAELGGVHELAVRAGDNGARHGTPVIVGRTGEVDPQINLFFRTGRMADAAPSTWRRYAYSLVVWAELPAGVRQKLGPGQHRGCGGVQVLAAE